MSKKVSLTVAIALMMFAVPATAFESQVQGTGVYNQTRAFGEITDAITLTGEWQFDSIWTHPSSPGTMTNDILLSVATPSTFYEHTVSPESGYYSDGNPGLDLTTTVQIPEMSLIDTAEIGMRGYDFTFDAATGSYESTKQLNVFDSHNYYSGGCSGNDQVPDIPENRDTAKFQVTDMSGSAYVVGGTLEYMKPYSSSKTSGSNVNLHQDFTKNSPTTSYVSGNHYATGHTVTTAYYGYDAAVDGSYDWYGQAQMDIKGNNKHDQLNARFVDAQADFYLKWSKCDPDTGVQQGKNHPMELMAFNNLNDFTAVGNAADIGCAGLPSFSDPLPWWYEAPSGQYGFSGSSFYRYDNTAVNWLASYDMSASTP